MFVTRIRSQRLGPLSYWQQNTPHRLQFHILRCISAQLSSASGFGGPGNRIVASFGGWLMGHNPATVSSSKLRDILCTPLAVSLLVGVPVRKARSVPLAGIT